jgi:hypothetical protein
MPQLETERLILHIPTLDDFDRWAEMMADAEAARFIGGVAPKTAVWRMIMQMNGAWDADRRRDVLRDRDIDRALGGSRWSVATIWMAGTGGRLGTAPRRVGERVRARGGERGDGLCVRRARVERSRALHQSGERALGGVGSAARGNGPRQATMPPPLDHEVLDLWGQSRGQWQRKR